MKSYPIEAKYCIGVPEMDAQHGYWIHLIEEFRRTASGHLMDEQGMAAAQQALVELLEYTQEHFRSEERFIKAHGYPHVEEHQRAHHELEREVVKLLDEIAAHRTRTTPLKLNLFVTVWLMEHIMEHDLDYARHLRAPKAKAAV